MSSSSSESSLSSQYLAASFLLGFTDLDPEESEELLSVSGGGTTYGALRIILPSDFLIVYLS